MMFLMSSVTLDIYGIADMPLAEFLLWPCVAGAVVGGLLPMTV